MKHRPVIGTLNESPLHAALKAWYTCAGDRCEVPVDGFVVDIVRDDLLMEIQLGGFAPIKQKLLALTADHAVRLIYPIAQDKWLLKLSEDGDGAPSRRMSPKHGDLVHVFEVLVSIPALIASPRFTLEVVLIHEEEVRRRDPKRGWRRHGWLIEERRLVDVLETYVFERPADLAALLPADLVEPWSTADLADALGERRRLAQQMAYCLRKMGAVTPVGKDGNAILYRIGGEG